MQQRAFNTQINKIRFRSLQLYPTVRNTAGLNKLTNFYSNSNSNPTYIEKVKVYLKGKIILQFKDLLQDQKGKDKIRYREHIQTKSEYIHLLFGVLLETLCVLCGVKYVCPSDPEAGRVDEAKAYSNRIE